MLNSKFQVIIVEILHNHKSRNPNSTRQLLKLLQYKLQKKLL